jgi:uncharacterized OB-fold protein
MVENATIAVSRPRQAFNRDNAFFAEGLRNGVVLIQRCAGCDEPRHPPRPMCSSCRSFEWNAVPTSGRAEIYSYAVHHHPALPGVAVPSMIVLVALEEGVRMVGNLVDGGEEDLRIGTPVEAVIRADEGDDMLLVQWRPLSART